MAFASKNQKKYCHDEGDDYLGESSKIAVTGYVKQKNKG
jgi:hypothetical protein